MSFLHVLLPTTAACLLNAIANGLWKVQFQKQPLVFKFDIMLTTLMSPYIILGICCYVVSMLIFFYLLSNFSLSIIIPLTALTYIFNLLLAFVIFKESFDTYRLAGVVIIILGVAILSKSKGV